LALLITVIFVPQKSWHVILAGIRAQFGLVITLLLFSGVAVSLIWAKGQHIDASVFRYVNLQGKRPLWLDWAMLAFTQIGQGFVTVAIALFLFVDVNHILAYELILGTLTLWTAVELVKVIINRSRPFIKLPMVRVVGPKAAGRSFPSGHTSQAFYTATLMIQYFKAEVSTSVLLYAVAFLVGVTRMYVGMHYPRDVMAGAFLGVFWGLLGVIVNAYIFV
jgi:membrane-associated phospholipid phosphatase